MLKLDPGNTQAEQGLQSLQTPTPPTPAASVAPLLLVPPDEAAPTATAISVLLATDELYSPAQATFDQKQWEQAVQMFDRLVGLNANYRIERRAGDAL